MDSSREPAANGSALDLEARASALLKRLQDHNSSASTVTDFEIRSLLKEARNMATMANSLERINQIIEQAIAEAKVLAANIGHTGKKH